MRIIATIRGEGFSSEITENDSGVVHFKADADIDADGANGQHGHQAAYQQDGNGSELLANGGMGIRNGKLVFIAAWGKDIAVADAHGDPLVVNGCAVSKTAYTFRGKSPSDPAAYVDSETVPYIVVPPVIINSVAGIVKGCQAYASFGTLRVSCVVADVGPRSKVGEISIALARRLGIPSSPRSGGIDTPNLDYEIHPGIPADIDGTTYELMPARGW